MAYALISHAKMSGIFGKGRSTNSIAWKLANLESFFSLDNKWTKYEFKLRNHRQNLATHFFDAGTNTSNFDKSKNLREQNFEGEENNEKLDEEHIQRSDWIIVFNERYALV